MRSDTIDLVSFQMEHFQWWLNLLEEGFRMNISDEVSAQVDDSNAGASVEQRFRKRRQAILGNIETQKITQTHQMYLHQLFQRIPT